MAATPHLSEQEIETYFRARVGELRRYGSQLRGRCPIHHSDHRDDSLAIERATGHWCCHSGCGGGGNLFEFEQRLSGCDFKQALDNVGAIIGRDLRTRRVVAKYCYTDAAGKLLYYIFRWEPKNFSAHRPDGERGIRGITRELYNLPAVLAAGPDDTIYITEGEKDADALIARGLVATTCAFGAGKWRKEYSKNLKGKRVVIVPDRDQKGEEHLQQVARSLQGKAASIKVLRLPTEREQVQ
jgi:DNA primase